MANIKESLEEGIIKGWNSEIMNYIGTGKRTPVVTLNVSITELNESLEKVKLEIQKKVDELNDSCVKYDQLAKNIAQETINKTLNPNKPYRKLELED